MLWFVVNLEGIGVSLCFSFFIVSAGIKYGNIAQNYKVKIMKKIAFLIVMLCLIQANINAQSIEKISQVSGDGYMMSIPPLYRSHLNSSPLLLMNELNEGGYRVEYLNSDFTVEKELLLFTNDSISIQFVTFADFDGHYLYDDDNRFLFSQTLFNNDDKIEYCRRIVENYYDEWESGGTRRYEIVNEDNEILFSIYCNNFYVIRWNDKDFLAALNYNDNLIDIYAINKGATESNIVKVKSIQAMSASPVLTRSNSVVNVTIDEALVADGGELVIFDSKGCAVSKQQFESGQTIVPIYTNRMRGGVYNITFNNGTKTENARIIVR